MAKVVIAASLPTSLRNFRGPLLLAFREIGCDVHAVAPGLIGDAETRDWLTERGVVCRDVPLARTALNPLSDLRTLIGLISLLRRLKPQIFLGYTAKPVIWGLWAARVAGVPQRVALITGLGYAFTGESTALRSMVRFILRCLYASALRCATLIFFQNSDDADEFVRLGLVKPGKRVCVINGSGVDLAAFSRASFPHAPLRFLLIARLLGDKGIREYVQAAVIIRQRWPEIEFHLVGGTDPNPDGIPQAEVEKWHNHGYVVWHGYQPDVRPFLASCHVYVLPSYREGMPRTVLEAMAMGRPIITTNAPGCRETVVHGENGFLVPVKSVDALVAAMERFILEPELIPHMGERSRQIAEEKYDVRKVNALILKEMGLK